MNIRETFLKLTKYTYPYETEYKLKNFLPKGIREDEFGNFYIKIGDSDTIFTSHLDTCSSHFEKVNHHIGSRFISTDGKTILGADDKAGVTIMLYMIHKNIPGLYYFFLGEEVGGLGSSAVAGSPFFMGYNKCVSFDRRGYNSIITDQFYGNCCSDEFAKELASRLNKANLSFNYRPDNTGVFTDSASFMDSIPECTNISVGYFNEHQCSEKQDIIFLTQLCEAVVKIDWDSLPVMRDPDVSYTKSNSDSNYISFGEVISATLTVWIGDERWKAKLSHERLLEERSFIYSWILRQDCYYDLIGIKWDGRTCIVEHSGISEFLGDREDLLYMIEELENIPVSDLDLICRLS